MVAKIFFFFAAAYTLFITGLSLVQLGDVSVGDFEPTDKLLHLGAYFCLVLLWNIYFLMTKQGFKNYSYKLLVVFGSSAAFGMLIEVLQGVLTSYREPDWYDILANVVGSLLATLLFFFLKNPLQRLKARLI